MLAGISLSHLLNDTVQSLLPAIYPMLKTVFSLSFAQVGADDAGAAADGFGAAAARRLYTDRRPMPYSLVIGMAFTLVGLLLLSAAPTFGIILAAALLMGIGSAVFHPESSRVARMASGGRHGLAQSVFQVGGNIGTSFGPLLGAFLVLPRGQGSIAWCALLALAGIAVLWKIGGWHREWRERVLAAPPASDVPPACAGCRRAASAGRWRSSRRSSSRAYFYLASLSSYYTFYLIAKFHLSVRTAQIQLFVFLGGRRRRAPSSAGRSAIGSAASW